MSLNTYTRPIVTIELLHLVCITVLNERQSEKNGFYIASLALFTWFL